MSEYIENALYFALDSSSEFDFGEPEEPEENEPEQTKTESHPTVTLVE